MQPAGTDSAKQEEIAVANGLSKEQWKSMSDAFTKRCTEPGVRAPARPGRHGGRRELRLSR